MTSKPCPFNPMLHRLRPRLQQPARQQVRLPRPQTPAMVPRPLPPRRLPPRAFAAYRLVVVHPERAEHHLPVAVRNLSKLWFNTLRLWLQFAMHRRASMLHPWQRPNLRPVVLRPVHALLLLVRLQLTAPAAAPERNWRRLLWSALKRKNVTLGTLQQDRFKSILSACSSSVPT